MSYTGHSNQHGLGRLESAITGSWRSFLLLDFLELRNHGQAIQLCAFWFSDARSGGALTVLQAVSCFRFIMILNGRSLDGRGLDGVYFLTGYVIIAPPLELVAIHVIRPVSYPVDCKSQNFCWCWGRKLFGRWPMEYCTIIDKGNA